MLKYLNDTNTTLTGLMYIKENMEIASKDVETLDALYDFVKKKFLFLFYDANSIFKDPEKYICFGRELNELSDKVSSLCDEYVERYYGNKIKLPGITSKISFVAASLLYNGFDRTISDECREVIMRDALKQNDSYTSKYRLPFAVCYSIYRTKQELYNEFGLPAVVHLERAKSLAVNTLGAKSGITAYAILCTEPEYRSELFGYSCDDRSVDRITKVLVKALDNRSN